MVASLPLFVIVAVPQLAMTIAATQRKIFRAMGVGFIWRSLTWTILRRFDAACQDLKSTALSGCEPVSFDLYLYCSSRSEAAGASLLAPGTPNAAKFMTIMTSPKRYRPIINPMAACMAKTQPSQIERVFFNQMKSG